MDFKLKGDHVIVNADKSEIPMEEANDLLVNNFLVFLATGTFVHKTTVHQVCQIKKEDLRGILLFLFVFLGSENSTLFNGNIR